MKLHRRRFLTLVACAGAWPVVWRAAAAQTYPMRPLRWIVGFPPGGGADAVSRIMASWLAERLGQPVVVENRPGATSNIAVQAVVNSPPDGHTLLLVPASAAVNVSLFDTLSFDLLRDIAPISGLIDFTLVLVANPSFPAKSVAELIAQAKASPGKITHGSFGTGSTGHVSAELFKMMAGINMVHVPYRGGAPMLVDLIGGQVNVAVDVLTGSLAHIKSGKLRALAVLSKARVEFLPEIPTIGETIAGYEANSWCGLGAPKGTPPEIVARLNREINAGLADPTVKARLAQIGTTPIFYTPSQFGAYMASEVEKWAKVIKSAGVKLE